MCWMSRATTLKSLSLSILADLLLKTPRALGTKGRARRGAVPALLISAVLPMLTLHDTFNYCLSLSVNLELVIWGLWGGGHFSVLGLSKDLGP